MNRRKLLGLMIVAGGGTVIGFGGLKWNQLTKTVDLAYLDQKRDLLAALAETIIPTTNTPGAREAGVGDFIYIMIKDCSDKKTQNKFLDGLKELEAHCSTIYHKSYTNCSNEAQIEVMRFFQQKGRPISGILGKAQHKFLGKSFFTTLKEYSAQGYCTSELGATKGLSYMAIPASYRGCMEITKGQNAWATK